MSMPLTYVLIRPARNEAEIIERTIKSVIVQTHRPVRWVIVSDEWTNGTDDIALKYCAIHEWTMFFRMPECKVRHFAGKVDAFNAGYASVKDRCYVPISGGTPHDSISENNYFTAASMPDCKLALVYVPSGRTIAVDLTRLSDSITARWHDPTKGSYEAIAGYPFPITTSHVFSTPGTHADGAARALVLETQ